MRELACPSSPDRGIDYRNIYTFLKKCDLTLFKMYYSGYTHAIGSFSKVILEDPLHYFDRGVAGHWEFAEVASIFTQFNVVFADRLSTATNQQRSMDMSDMTGWFFNCTNLTSAEFGKTI